MPDDSSSDELRRNRRAAEDALQQLDWCIGYLHGLGKTKLSRVLSQNRSTIRSDLMNIAPEPLPSSQTEET
jgi:hypothetical protein